MQRREFITLLGGATAAWPLAARAQQQRLAMPVVGMLSSGASPGLPTPRPAIFRQVLSENGFVEGRNVAFELARPDGQVERLLALAAGLVQRRVTMIYAGGLPPAQAAKAATNTIPIVFSMGEDPVKEGIVASLNRPGGNITGFSSLSNLLIPKRLEVLRELLPGATTFGLLVNSTNPNAEPDGKEARAAAAVLGLRVQILRAGTEDEIDAAFASAAQQRLAALLVGVDPWFRERQVERMVALAARHAVPTIYERRGYPDAGGLMSYGTDDFETSRQAALYIARILKGAKPADLPVQQSTKYEFVLNLKAAKALHLDVPTAVLLRATEVIE